MKILRIRLELQIEPDEFGLYLLQTDARQFLTDLRDNAIGHGFTVTTEPVEDAKGLRKVAGQAKGGNARAAKLSPERRSEIAKQAADTRWSGEAALSVVPEVA